MLKYYLTENMINCLINLEKNKDIKILSKDNKGTYIDSEKTNNYNIECAENSILIISLEDLSGWIIIEENYCTSLQYIPHYEVWLNQNKFKK